MPTTSRSVGASRKITRHVAFLALLAISIAGVQSVRADGPDARAAWPPVTNETRPWTRWWWMGNLVEEREISAALETYARAGLGGVEITPIYGVRGREDDFIDYLSPRWMEVFLHTLEEAKRLGLGVDMATGTGWPFGGPWVRSSDACRYLARTSWTLAEGQRLEERVRLVERPLVRAVGRRVAISELRDPVGKNDDLQALALEQVRFEKSLPLVALVARGEDGETIDLTSRVGPDGKLDWVAPPGAWKLWGVFAGWHGKLVERAGPGGEGDVIDHFSSRALRNYLSRFDEAFGGHDISSLRAFFNDSYEVDDAAGEASWTERFFGEFRSRRGYELRGELPALLGDGDEDRVSRVRCDFRETISDLLLEEFTVPWRRWAAGHTALVRNQAHGAPANLLDLYAASDIPETEGDDVIKFKSASSAAHVTGKRLASSECATWLDEHFLATLGDVKRAVDHFFLGGINHICYHGTTFSPRGEPWPGWMFYASVHFGPTNTFWENFAALNAYVTRCQSFLQAGEPAADVLLWLPIHDRWSRRGRALLEHFDGSVTGTGARAAAETLLERGYDFDFISDRQVAALEVDGGGLVTAGGSHRALLVPRCERMPLATLEKLVALARQGAMILFEGALPTDVPGLSRLEERRGKLGKLVKALESDGASDAADLENRGLQRLRAGDGRVLLGEELGLLLAEAGIPREPMVDLGLRCVRRDTSSGRTWWIVNQNESRLDARVPLSWPAAGPAVLFDPLRGTRGLVTLEEAKEGSCRVRLQLEPGESVVLRAFRQPSEAPEADATRWRYANGAGESHALEGPWMIDFLAGGPTLPPATTLERLGSWTELDDPALKTFSGSARYRMRFSKPAGDADLWRLALGAVHESARVRLNGRDLATLITEPFSVDIPAASLREKNDLEIVVSNTMANRIADMDRRGVSWKKFYNVNFAARRRENSGRDRVFTAARWEPRPSGLLGPVTLTPQRVSE